MTLQKSQAVIIGGGITGLSAACRLEQEGYDYTLLEATGRVGGLCKSERAGGYTFDYTGHLLHFTKPEVEHFVKGVLKGRLEEQGRRAWVYTNDVFTRYPFQRSLYGLPRDVVKECLLDYVEAEAGGAVKREGDFASWAEANFGHGICRHFMMPYNRKLWQTDPGELTWEWTGRFVPNADPVGVIRGAFSPAIDEVGYNVRFWYPGIGGIEILPESLAASLKGVRCNKRVTAIDLVEKVVSLEDGDSCAYERLISTIPLPELVCCLTPVPRSVREAASGLAFTSVLDVNIGLSTQDLTDKHWVYVPDPAIPFYRIGFPHNFSPSLVPEGRSSVYAEISHIGNRGWDEGSVVRDVLLSMRTMGFPVFERDVEVVKIMELKYAYVVYDFSRRENLHTIGEFLKTRDVASVGRFGSWSYLSMEDSIEEGLRAGSSLLQ
jgi:protoporphyrinogen oxidase